MFILLLGNYYIYLCEKRNPIGEEEGEMNEGEMEKKKGEEIGNGKLRKIAC